MVLPALTGTTAGVRAPSARAHPSGPPQATPVSALPTEAAPIDGVATAGPDPGADSADADTGGTVEERLQRLEAEVAELVRSTARDHGTDGVAESLARRAATFDAALAEQAEDDRERNAILALWAEQRKRDDALTDAVIKLI